MTAVAVNHLFKSYADKTAVNDLTFSVDPGEILGLIGPNGAGKSSTLKIILDFMKPDSGEVKIFGHQMNEATKNQIGYLPEEKGLYKNLAAIDLILYLASLKGMDNALAEKKANVLLQQTGMLESKKMKIKHMSKGMGQIIQFIVTIIHDPKLIILDEPFSGLDPVNTDIMKSTIGNLRDEGKAIILSTHEMNQVEELCDRVLMINHGSEVLYGNLKDIKASELVLAPDTTPQIILDQLRDHGLAINRFEITTPSLNDIFLHIAGVTHE
jgi:ABC-2 type transport system ATP-binding protein